MQKNLEDDENADEEEVDSKKESQEGPDTLTNAFFNNWGQNWGGFIVLYNQRPRKGI